MFYIPDDATEEELLELAAEQRAVNQPVELVTGLWCISPVLCLREECPDEAS